MNDPKKELLSPEAVRESIGDLRRRVRLGKFLESRELIEVEWEAWRRALPVGSKFENEIPLDRLKMATLSWEVFDALGDTYRAQEKLLADGLRHECEGKMRQAVQSPRAFLAQEFASGQASDRGMTYDVWRQRTMWVLALGFQFYRREKLDDAEHMFLLVAKFLNNCLGKANFACNGTKSRLYYFLGHVQQANDHLSRAALFFDRSLQFCRARLRERCALHTPGSPAYEVERSFAYYCLGKLELKMGELDYDQGRVQSASRHAYAASALLHTSADPYLRHVAEILICRIERSGARLTVANWELATRIESCCLELKDHSRFQLEALVEKVRTTVYLLHHVPELGPGREEASIRMRAALSEVEDIIRQARTASIRKTQFRAGLVKAETLLRLREFRAASDAVSE